MSRSLSQEKLALAKEFEKGAFTVEDFCRLHGIQKHNLYYWRRKLRSASTVEKPLFLPLDVRTKASKRSVLEVSLPNGVEIRFEKMISAEYLRTLLGAW